MLYCAAGFSVNKVASVLYCAAGFSVFVLRQPRSATSLGLPA